MSFSQPYYPNNNLPTGKLMCIPALLLGAKSRDSAEQTLQGCMLAANTDDAR